jgi:LacI family transcriptional regulator, repressor for deo operon, udp, cdd, tsx, nupC, and nupG
VEGTRSAAGRVKRATVKQVAERAGVSPSTVSNVLNDHPYVTSRVRERVEAAIAEVGYRPSLVGRQLRRGRSAFVSLAIPDIRSPYFSDLAHTVIVAARRQGFVPLIDETGGDLAREREVAGGYASRLTEGIVFCPVAISPAEIERLASDVPMVLLGEHFTGGSFDHIAIDSRRSAEEVAEYLVGCGCRRFAFIGNELAPGPGPGRYRLAGLRASLAAHGIELADDLVFPTAAHSREEGARVAEVLVARRDRVDALVCAADLVAVGALRVFHRAGVAVPGDVSVVGWDDSPEGRYAWPALTTVAHDLELIARQAIESVVSRQHDAGLPPRRYTVPHRLVMRDSTGTPVRR